MMRKTRDAKAKITTRTAIKWYAYGITANISKRERWKERYKHEIQVLQYTAPGSSGDISKAKE